MGYQVTGQRGDVQLPAAGVDPDEGGGIDVTTWGDTIGNVRAFVNRNAPHARLDPETGMFPAPALAPVRAVLVHRDDNDYNPNAIGLSLPAAAGGTRDDRHLGYLSEATLRRLGAGTLPRLIEFAGGEVTCTVRIVGPEDLVLDLPAERTLAEAVAEFLGGHGSDARHSGTHLLTRHTRAHLCGPRVPRQTVTGVRVTANLTYDEPRPLTVTDAGDGRTLGTLRGRLLLLADERDRDEVLPLLRTAGIDVDGPVRTPTVAEDGTWPADLVPDVHHYQLTGGLDLRVPGHDDPREAITFAVHNPATGALWVEDDTLVAPALRYLHRAGIDPATVATPSAAWGLDAEISRRDLYDQSHPLSGGVDIMGPSRLPADRKTLVPAGVFTAEEVTWLRTPATPVRDNSQRVPAAPALLGVERFVRERSLLFPGHTLTGNAAECRLCGREAVAFTTPICTEPVAYCHLCLHRAVHGVVTDRARSAKALRALARVEFDDQPMLADQVVALHRNPDEPVPATDIDRSVLLRFAIPATTAWTLLLEAAGFAEDGLRVGRGTLIRSRDGHLCLSLREKAVCDFLHLHRIAHDREPRYPADPDYNPSGLRRADWILDDGTLVELWGMPNDPAYAAKIDDKRALAARHQIQLVEIFDEDLPHLPEVFADWVDPATDTTWTWTPALVQSPAAGPGTSRPARTRDTTTAAATSAAPAAPARSNCSRRA